MSTFASAATDLGFATAQVPLGSHICQIYVDEEERDSALLKFITRGLLSKESTACFSDNVNVTALRVWCEREGLSLDDERNTGSFLQSGAEAVYFQDGHFDPDRILDLLTKFHEDSVNRNSTGARVIGEMSPAITRVEGGSRLFAYEARVNHVLQKHPVTAVCQYDARAFDGATIMDVLTVHPMMVLRGAVVQNPLFIPPDEFIRQ